MMNRPPFPSVVVDESSALPLSDEPLPNLYSPAFLRALEYTYNSEGIISSGGTESVDAMLRQIDLDNRFLLDVGCGFGGVDIYLAKKFKVTITGVDREPFLIKGAHRLLSRSSEPLKGSISYQTLLDPFRLTEFVDNTFDVVLSKQVLYHLVPEKRAPYLQEIHRVLKPGGTLVIEDWLVAKQPYTELVSKALGIDPTKPRKPFCYLVTPEEYCSCIRQAKFQDLNFVDNTDQQVAYTEKDVQRIRESSEPFSSELGQRIYERVSSNFDRFLKAMKPHEILSGIFTATKGPKID